MKVAIEGCCHGELDNIYASIAKAESEGNFKTDLLLLCGDFQAIRNRADLDCLAVPAKYRQLGEFHRYYAGEKVAPVLTLVIGGNHEASNYMWELYHGGWLAPNIYYLGAAGCVDVGGLKVAGASGIFKHHDYNRGRYEKMPYDKSDIRSIYHTRVYDIFRLKLLDPATSRPDIVMSHDWPNTIEQHGDTAALKRKKPFFKQEIDTSTLGSPPLLELLRCLRPKYWFSAHLHVKFAAKFRHLGGGIGQGGTGGEPVSPKAAETSNPEALDIDLDEDEPLVSTAERNGTVVDPSNSEEIAIDMDSDAEGDQPLRDASKEEERARGSQEVELADRREEAQETRFLALSKCLPGHDFLQFLDVDAPEFDQTVAAATSAGGVRPSPRLRFSKRWLAITKATHHLLSLRREQARLPRVGDAALLRRIAEEEAWLDRHVSVAGGADGEGASTSQTGGELSQEDALDVLRVQTFVRTAPAAFEPGGGAPGPPPWYTNPQTEALCRWLEVENKINPPPPLPPQPQPQLPPSTAVTEMGPRLPGASGATPGRQHGEGEADAVRRIEEAALRARDVRSHKRHKGEASAAGEGEDMTEGVVEAEPLRLDDEEDEGHARWKEGTG
ncbi:unnamed protein product [Parajaminaea phylloscopi]